MTHFRTACVAGHACTLSHGLGSAPLGRAGRVADSGPLATVNPRFSVLWAELRASGEVNSYSLACLEWTRAVMQARTPSARILYFGPLAKASAQYELAIARDDTQ
jgi:hypothetical protein